MFENMNGNTTSSTPLQERCSLPTEPSFTDAALGDPSTLPPNAIAIVGMSLKFPGDATTIETFWQMMMQARSTASTFPRDRTNHGAHYSSDPTATGTVCILQKDLNVADRY
jgi:hypothetical protein